jgi:hypothetical protein
MLPDRFRRPSTEEAPPDAPPAAAGPGAFVALPPGFFLPVAPDLGQWQVALYQWAFAQAQELLRPSLCERDWLGVWN